MKPSSVKDERLYFLPEREDVMNYKACPDGSMMRGYLLNLLRIMAFSVQRSSEGNLLDFQMSLSLALDRYSINDRSLRYLMSEV